MPNQNHEEYNINLKVFNYRNILVINFVISDSIMLTDSNITSLNWWVNVITTDAVCFFS